MYRLTKLDLGSVALYSFVMFLIISLVIMLPMGFFSMFFFRMLPNEIFRNGPGLHFFRFLPGFFFFVFPIFYAIMGTVINTIIALVYNLLSIKMGGIRFDLEKVATFTPPTQTSEIPPAANGPNPA